MSRDGTMRYRLHRRSVVGGSLPDVFAFFKNPFNLEAITPPWLGFRILGTSDNEVAVGTRIRYRLRLHGIPLTWASRIAEYVDGERFADEQIVGPYRRWYHLHLFRAVDGGVAIEDIVDYEMPFGPLGRFVHFVAVRRQLNTIFDYRAEQIRRRFPSLPAHAGHRVHS